MDGMGMAAFSKVAWSKDDILGPYLDIVTSCGVLDWSTAPILIYWQ